MAGQVVTSNGSAFFTPTENGKKKKVLRIFDWVNLWKGNMVKLHFDV